ncbi:MAG TPA: hypothetical protein VIP05_34130 [Burkholderiaceae bacterium]
MTLTPEAVTALAPFPALMAAALRRDDVALRAAANGMVDSPSAR